MAYRNAWGDEGTYAEVFKATVARMDTDALVVIILARAGTTITFSTVC